MAPKGGDANFQPENRDLYYFLLGVGSSFEGSRDFCLQVDVTSCGNSRIPAATVEGKWFYFETNEPYKASTGDYYYPMVIESGSRIFYRTTLNRRHPWDSGVLRYFVSKKEYNEFMNYDSAIHEAIDLRVEERILKYPLFGELYRLSDGSIVNQNWIQASRTLAEIGYVNSDVIDNLTNRTTVEFDEIERHFAISFQTQMPVRTFTVAKEGRVSGPFYSIIYTDENWIFLENITFVINGERLDVGLLNVSRNTISGAVIEQASVSPVHLAELTQMLKNAETVTVRMRGRRGTKDIDYPENEVEYLRNAINLVHSMRKR